MKNCFNLTILIFLLLIIPFISDLNGQVGSRVALNFSYFSFSEEIREKNDRINKLNLGLELGLYTTINLSDKFEIEPFFNFTKYGNTVDLGDEYSGTHSFYNLHFSLLPKYVISINGKRKFSIFVGPNVGLGLGQPKFKFCSPSGCETMKSSYSGVDEYDYQLWNFGAIIGTQYDMSSKIKIDFRFIKYFSDLYKLTDIYRTNTISIGVSYNYF